jgi:hypothetical protein
MVRIPRILDRLFRGESVLAKREWLVGWRLATLDGFAGMRFACRRGDRSVETTRNVFVVFMVPSSLRRGPERSGVGISKSMNQDHFYSKQVRSKTGSCL